MSAYTPDQAMQALLRLYEPLMKSDLRNGHPYVIWVTPDRWDEAQRAKAPWLTLCHERDMEVARMAWAGREDPHGWSPTLERCVAVIAPRV